MKHLLVIVKPTTITMKIVKEKVKFKSRVAIGFLIKKKTIDKREMRCAYVQGV